MIICSCISEMVYKFKIVQFMSLYYYSLSFNNIFLKFQTKKSWKYFILKILPRDIGKTWQPHIIGIQRCYSLPNMFLQLGFHIGIFSKKTIGSKIMSKKLHILMSRGKMWYRFEENHPIVNHDIYNFLNSISHF